MLQKHIKYAHEIHKIFRVVSEKNISLFDLKNFVNKIYVFSNIFS